LKAESDVARIQVTACNSLANPRRIRRDRDVVLRKRSAIALQISTR
jgi:hypothetical protein